MPPLPPPSRGDANAQYMVTSLYFYVYVCMYVCRRSGLYLGHYYGPGNGQTWLDNVQCTGSELSLAECRHRGWGIHNCAHREDVSIICSPHSSTLQSRFYVRQLCGSTYNRYRLDVCLSVCLSVCPSHAGTVSKRLNILSCFLHHTIAHSF